MLLSDSYQNLHKKIKKEALAIEVSYKLNSFDVLHIATACSAPVDFFLTCDYSVIKKCRGIIGNLIITSPLDFLANRHYEKCGH